MNRTLVTLATFFVFLISPIRGSQAITGIENIPTYPSSEILCSQHVAGQPMHILWKSFGTPDPIPSVVAYFEQKLNVKAAAGEHHSLSLVSSDNKELKVTIFPLSSAKNFPSCGKVPQNSTQTVIHISQAIRNQIK